MITDSHPRRTYLKKFFRIALASPFIPNIGTALTPPAALCNLCLRNYFSRSTVSGIITHFGVFVNTYEKTLLPSFSINNSTNFNKIIVIISY